MQSVLLHLPPRNPIHRVIDSLRIQLRRAQENPVDIEFDSSGSLCGRVFEDLKLSVPIQADLIDKPASHLADLSFSALRDLFSEHFMSHGIADRPARLHAFNVAQHIQLLRAFEDPESVLDRVTRKVAEKVETFPRKARDIEVGRNPGDVMDPYILAANQLLLFQGGFTQAISATVAHKALMIIEGLLGHLHEDVIGEMRGNVRSLEPRGFNQEILDLHTNPFPGADIVQPPTQPNAPIRFHQVKSKTGSAKGGDAKRLGEQLLRLEQYYKGQTFYDALIGNTLRGHRSMRGVLSVSPNVVVLVGEAAFRELTNSSVGPELLLRVYQAAFAEVSRRTGYNIETMAIKIVAAFKEQAQQVGSDFLEFLLGNATSGPPEQQDSRVYVPATRRR